jgi:hypothetical protein
MTLDETIAACLAFVRSGGHEGDEGPSAEAAFAQAHAHLSAMKEALEQIKRGPVMPPPDPGAHSWQAWGRFWHEQTDRLRVIAMNALSNGTASDQAAGDNDG